jgi:hypothetical protein
MQANAPTRMPWHSPEWLRRLRDGFSSVPAPVLVFAICFAIYSYRPLIQSSMDNQPLRFGAVLLATRGNLDYTDLLLNPDYYYSFRRTRAGTLASHTPIGTALLGAPFFWLAHKVGLQMLDENIVLLDSLTASFLTAFAAALMAWLVRRHGRPTALFLGLAFGLATASWSTASRAMWQHTGAQFSLLAALAFFDGDDRRLWRIVAGVAMLAMTVACRPFLAPACAVILLFELRTSWRYAVVGGVVGLTAASLWLFFNWRASGTPLGTYLEAILFKRALGLRTFMPALFGSLISPNRGMLVFSPLLIPGVVLVPWALARWREDSRLAVMALCAGGGILMRGFRVDWHGGYCYGSRFMLDVSPFLLLLMAPFVDAQLEGRWRRRAGLVALVAVSVFIQYLGAVRDYESWNIAMKMSDPANAWNWRKPQILHCLTLGASTRRVSPPLPPEAYRIPLDGVLQLRMNPDTPHILYGFSQTQPYGLYMLPPRAAVAVNLPAKVPVQLKVDMAAEGFRFDPVVVRVLFNGHEIGNGAFLKADFKFRNVPVLPVREEYVNQGMNLIEFLVSGVNYKGAVPTPLGVAIDKIRILPTDTATIEKMERKLSPDLAAGDTGRGQGR